MINSKRKINNPNFDRLLEQVRLENKIYEAKKLYFNQALTLICDFAFTKDEIK